MTTEYEREKQDALAMESLSQGEWFSQAFADFAQLNGAIEPDREWLLSDYDVWVKNPHYRGEPGAHPEDDEYWNASEEERAVADADRRARREAARAAPPAPNLDQDIPF